MYNVWNFGIASKNKVFEKESIREIVDTMLHRGPNDSGIWLSKCKSISFAHRRLSIIDLSENAKQPMVYNSGKYVITYNGELYNFAEIRDILIKKGYSFNSKSDTEVILKSYTEWGYDCLKYFNGMFAFAILDHSKTEYLWQGIVLEKNLFITLRITVHLFFLLS